MNITKIKIRSAKALKNAGRFLHHPRKSKRNPFSKWLRRYDEACLRIGILTRARPMVDVGCPLKEWEYLPHEKSQA